MKIESERLIIRSYQEDDLEELSEYLCDKQHMHYIPESFNVIDDVKDFMDKEGHKFYMVILKEEDRLIGHLSFFSFFEEHSYEIGWVFHKNYTKQGYAYEAAYALLDYGFKSLNIHRVIATAQPENVASWRLMEKLKMRREAHFKQCIPYQETWWDEYYYAILRDEWE